MKFKINKFILGTAAALLFGATSCTGDLDQMPQDPNQVNLTDFASNPRQYLGGALAKCYSGLAVASQDGQSGDCDISGVDGGSSQWSRVNFYLEDLPTDVGLWIWSDEGVPALVQDSWDSGNKFVYCAYSRYYAHIAVCNEFLRLSRNLGEYGISLDDAMQKELAQFCLEARALRALSYYYVIDLFGPATVAWDDMPYGATPPQAESRKALYDKVVSDLEDVEANFQEGTPVYGRIGIDAVRALLCKYYLNAEVYTGKAEWDKCWAMAQKIITKHQGGGYDNSGLANSYLSLFCGNNDLFMPGGGLADQNEILWGIPYDDPSTVSWGGSVFLVLAPIFKGADVNLTAGEKGFCNQLWYGVTDGWGCLLAREEFVKKFGFVDGQYVDERSMLWMTEKAGFDRANNAFGSATDGYPLIKYTNVLCNASDGTMPVWSEVKDGVSFPRIGVRPVEAVSANPNTDVAILRLADVYLMAAEASLHGANGSSQSEGLKYVNYLRGRANVSKWTAAEFTLDNLLDERGRELYMEATRRTDLIRHNKFVSGYDWSWKGGMRHGTDLRSTMVLYPFPTNVKAVYGDQLKQNDGY